MDIFHLNYQHLSYFRAIAHEGGVIRAAAKLRLSPSTLSMQLKTLEDALGKKLFERRRQRLILTEAGRTALAYADQIFHSGAELINALNDRLSSNELYLEIGIVESIPKTLLSHVLKSAFQIEDCLVSVESREARALFDDILHGRLDAGITDILPPLEQQDRLRARPVLRSPVGVFGAPKLAKLRKDFPRSLESQPFLLPTLQSQIRAHFESYLRHHQISVRKKLVVADTALQKTLAGGGHGLIVLPEIAAAPLVREKRLVNIGHLTGVTCDYWMLFAPRRVENPAVTHLKRVLHHRTR